MAAESPAAPATPPAKTYPRKTRTPDWLTFIGITQPAFYDSDQKSAINAARRGR
jgi:hypothetical protein